MNYTKKEYNTLCKKQKKTHKELENMIDDMYDAGVDVSFFPQKAELILIEYSQKLTQPCNEYSQKPSNTTYPKLCFNCIHNKKYVNN